MTDHPTPADVTLAFLCSLARARASAGDALPPHRPCRLCHVPPAELAAWAERFGRPVDPLPALPRRARR